MLMYLEMLSKVNSDKKTDAVLDLVNSSNKLAYDISRNEISKQFNKGQTSIKAEEDNVKAAIRKVNEILDMNLDEDKFVEIAVGLVVEIFDNRK